MSVLVTVEKACVAEERRSVAARCLNIMVAQVVVVGCGCLIIATIKKSSEIAEGPFYPSFPFTVHASISIHPSHSHHP